MGQFLAETRTWSASQRASPGKRCWIPTTIIYTAIEARIMPMRRVMMVRIVMDRRAPMLAEK